MQVPPGVDGAAAATARSAPLPGATTVGREPSALRRFLPGAAALVLYLVLSIALLSGTLFAGADRTVGNTADPGQFIWYLAWVPYALGHHLDPLLTTYLRSPAGANLMWNTPITFPALVMAPVTVLLGPLTSYNVLAVLGFALSGWCAYFAVRRYTVSSIPAIVGGLLYGFSPYMYAQSTSHMNLELAMFPPLALLLFDEILVRQRAAPLVIGGLLGLAAAAQFLTSSELLAITALLSVPALLVILIWHRARFAERRGYAGRALGAAVIVFALLAAFPLYIQFLGPERPAGVFQVQDYYVASLRNFVSPTGHQWLGLLGRSTSPDSDAFIGVPLLALAAITLVWLRRHAVVWAASVVLAASMVLSLGGYLWLHGVETGIPLPWLLFDHLPLSDQILPIRVMVIGYLALAVVVGIFLDRCARSGRPGRIALGAGATAVALIPLLPGLPYPTNQWSIPAFFTDGAVDMIPAGSTVYIPPDKVNLEALVWQAASGMRFRTQLGWVFTPAPLPQPWITEFDPLGTELYDLGELGQSAPAEISATQRHSYLGDLAATGAGTVIIGPEPGEGQAVALMADLLGRQGQSIGGIVVWTGVGLPQGS